MDKATPSETALAEAPPASVPETSGSETPEPEARLEFGMDADAIEVTAADVIVAEPAPRPAWPVVLETRIASFFASRSFLAALGAVIFLPLVWYEDPESRRFRLALPAVTTGDEPHYLLMLNSVINDGDLDLSNNYQSAHSGSQQAGRRFAGRPLDHHTRWYVGDRAYRWSDLHYRTRWQPDDRGGVTPMRQKPEIDITGLPEFSSHPAGLAILLAPVAFLFRQTEWVEPIALLCSCAATIVGMVLFNRLLMALGASQLHANLATLLVFLGTPIWHYSRTLYTEPYMVCCAIAAYYFALSGNRFFLAGVFVGVGMLLKGPFLLLALPLGLYILFRVGFRQAVLFSAPVLLAIGFQLSLNRYMFGMSSRVAMPFVSGSLLAGTTALLFSPVKGVLPFLPVLLLAGGILRPATIGAREAAILVGFLLYFLVIAYWRDWHGGYCFGPRLILPVVPLMLIGLRKIGDLWNSEAYIGRTAIAVICGLSIFINALGAFQPGNYNFTHPLLSLLRASGG